MKVNDERKSVAVVGGGITGITAALELGRTHRCKVILFEKEQELGGLSTYYRWEDITCDRFYHVILPQDREIQKFISSLGLGSKLLWQNTNSGFFGNKKLVSLSSTSDFIKFPFLSLWQKLRLGLGILYTSRIKDSSRLDKIFTRQWLTRIFGNRIYEVIWDPLLRSKLGEARERTSASFIWANIKRLYRARSSGTKREKMGYVQGGYNSILKTAEEKLTGLNVEIMRNSPVWKVDIDKKRSLINVHTENSDFKFKKLLFTIPNPYILNLLNIKYRNSYWEVLKQIEYLDIICVLLIIKRPLSRYYVINILDKDIPFTGIIAATNVIPPQDLGERHLVYLPKYLTHDDALCEMSDDQIIQLFIEKLKTIFRNLKDEEILHIKVFHEEYVQPIFGLNSDSRNISFQTTIPNIYIANTSMINDSTINNNAAINLAKKAADKILSDLDGR